MWLYPPIAPRSAASICRSEKTTANSNEHVWEPAAIPPSSPAIPRPTWDTDWSHPWGNAGGPMATSNTATKAIEAARAFRPRILAERDRIEAGRRLPEGLARDLARAGFFRI